MRLRVASYNVHKCVGTDRRYDPGRVVDVLNAVSADIVALQEVDHRLGARPAALPPAMIAEQTDFAPVQLNNGATSLGWHGQVLLMKQGLELIEAHQIALPGLEPRGAVLARFTLGHGAQICVVGVHLGLLRTNRTAQMRALRAALAAHPPCPTVILGDFNEWSARGGMAPLTDHFRVHAPGRSFPAQRPTAALDRVALGEGVHLRDAGVVDIPLARRASDHLPIWADITLS